MATIDYKQKIKDYMNSSEVDTLYKSMLNNLFPELAESDDEKIRKGIIRNLEYLMDRAKGFVKDELKERIAWLEKQCKNTTTLPKWKYKKDNAPLLRDSLILNKYGCVAKLPSGAIVSDVWVIDYDELAKLPKEELEKQGEQNHISRDTKPRTYVDFYKRLTEPEQEYLQDYIDRVIEKTKELQRQGEQKPVPDWMPKFLDELRSKKNYFDWDEDKDIEGGILAIIKWMNSNYFNGKDNEQNSADNVEPKFNVGDKIISTISNIPYYVTEVRNGYYLTDAGCVIMFNAQDNFELSNQNPVWGEEDERILNTVIHNLRYPGVNYYKKPIEEEVKWLKFLKDRVQFQNRWKPSDEQIEALNRAMYHVEDDVATQIAKLIGDLKKLREE